MINAKGLLTLNHVDADALIKAKKDDGWKIYKLPTNISSKDDFFHGVRQTLPLDPPLHSNHSWDALADSLWAGLEGLTADKIVIVWPTYSIMETRSPKDFNTANEIMTDLPKSLANIEITAGKTKKLLVLRVT